MEQIVGWTFINPCCPLIFLWVVWTTMQKIASPQDLQAELQRLLAYSQGQNPSREKIASALNGLADRVAAKDNLGEAHKYVQKARNDMTDIMEAMPHPGEDRGSPEYKAHREKADDHYDIVEILDKVDILVRKAIRLKKLDAQIHRAPRRKARVAARGALEEAQTALYKAKDETFSQLEAMARAGDEHLRTREYRAHQDIAENLDKALGSVSKAIKLQRST